jgi:endogenous inhibitor of DNA gyrase (YacG/DUF329 family)
MPMLVKCPQCSKETAWEENPFRPFCSERCRLIDLGKWASDEYRIASDEKTASREEKNEKKL